MALATGAPRGGLFGHRPPCDRSAPVFQGLYNIQHNDNPENFSLPTDLFTNQFKTNKNFWIALQRRDIVKRIVFKTMYIV